jgi:prevent-host-death family protein
MPATQVEQVKYRKNKNLSSNSEIPHSGATFGIANTDRNLRYQGNLGHSWAPLHWYRIWTIFSTNETTEAAQIMKLSESVKPISYLKSHTAEALRDVSEGQRTMVITQHGEAKAVLQDIASYEQTQESLALLKMLAQSSKSIQEGRSKPLKKAFADVRKHIRELAE